MEQTQWETPVRVLLVEDEPLWQAGIEALLQADPRFTLAGVADNYDTALRLFHTEQPQLILLDWKIRGEQDGLAVGHELLKLGVPSERIILISSSQASAIPRHPFLHVPKNQLSEDLLPLLQSVTIGSH